MNVLMGIGNELKGDDGIGNAIAREFKAPGWKSIPCETVPENFTSVVKRESPELLVLVDATEMGLDAGEFRIVPKEKLGSSVEGTHGIPLQHLVTYLEESAQKIVFIGVQPGSMTMGEGLSPAVKEAKESIMRILCEDGLSGVKSL